MSRTKSERDILNERSYQCISLKIYCCFLWLTRSMFDCLSITFDFYSIAFDCYSITFDCYSIAFNLWKYCIRHFFFCCCYFLAWIKKKLDFFLLLKLQNLIGCIKSFILDVWKERKRGGIRAQSQKERAKNFFFHVAHNTLQFFPFYPKVCLAKNLKLLICESLSNKTLQLFNLQNFISNILCT